MPSEIAHVAEVAKRLGSTNRQRWAAPLETFDRFFDVLLTFKEATNIVNTGTALIAMAEIAEAWLSEHNATEHDQEN